MPNPLVCYEIIVTTCDGQAYTPGAAATAQAAAPACALLRLHTGVGPDRIFFRRCWGIHPQNVRLLLPAVLTSALLLALLALLGRVGWP